MFRILRIIRLIRVVRILRFSRYNQNLQTLGRSLIKSTREIGFLIMFYLIFSVLCATIAYYLENEVNDTGFTSIPDSLWWAIVTMTTVGYGDMYPQTGLSIIHFRKLSWHFGRFYFRVYYVRKSF